MNLITDPNDERLVAGKYGDDDVRNASMTPPPWEPGVVGHEGEITTDKEKIKAHICESIDKATEDRPAYLVTAKEGDETVTICYTGNGPYSSAHAQAIAYLPNFIEALEIRDASLRAALAERDEARGKVKQLEIDCAQLEEDREYNAGLVEERNNVIRIIEGQRDTFFERIKVLEAAVEWACNELDSQALKEATGVEYFRVSMWFKAELRRRAGKESA